jgi:hypothetical protein
MLSEILSIVPQVVKVVSDTLTSVSHFFNVKNNHLNRSRDSKSCNHNALRDSFFSIHDQLRNFKSNQPIDESILKKNIENAKKSIEEHRELSPKSSPQAECELFSDIEEYLGYLQNYLNNSRSITVEDIDKFFTVSEKLSEKFTAIIGGATKTEKFAGNSKLYLKEYSREMALSAISISVILLGFCVTVYATNRVSLFILNKYSKSTISSRQSPIPVKQACNAVPSDLNDQQYAQNMLIKSFDNPFFDILESEIKQESKGMKSLRNKNTTPDLALNYMIHYSKQYPTNDEADLFKRYIPLVRILNRNKKIENNHPDKVQFYVSVVVSLTNNIRRVRGPDPQSLGVLRGIDYAQEKIFNKNQLFFKILLVDDSNQYSERLFPDYQLSSISSNPSVVALLGHNNYISFQKYSNCYLDKRLPIFLTSMSLSNDSSNHTQETLHKHLHVPSLLPSVNQLSRSTINFIRKRRLDLSLRESPSKLVLFFDSKDPTSVSLKDALCSYYKEISLDKTDCIDINLRTVSPLINANYGDSEWILAFNPFRNQFKNETLDILSARAKQAMPWVYVSPDYYDANLISDLQKSLDIKREKAYQEGKHFRLTVFRIAPPDWRNESEDKRSFDSKSLYGDRQNWTTYNSFNSLMALWTIIRDIDPSPNPKLKQISNLRNQIIDMQRNIILPLSVPWELVLRKDENQRFSLSGPGHKLCEAQIIVIPKNQIPIASCKEPPAP